MKGKIVAILAVALLAASFAIAASDADAEPGFGDLPSIGGFDDMGGGSITVYLDNPDEDAASVTVRVLTHGTDSVLAESKVDLAAGADNVPVILTFGFQSSGYRYIDLVLLDADGAVLTTQAGIQIDVGHSIWKDSLTYIIIIAAIIIIVVIAYLYMRNAPKRKAEKMSDRTFTEMEEARRQKKSAPSGPTKYEGSGGRKRK